MKVYFIGAGPGDPELITVKGKKALRKADIIIYAGSLVNPEVLKQRKAGAELLNSAQMNREEISSVYDRAFQEGKNVARVHSGCPTIFGALQEQIDYLQERGIEYEIIPGVNSLSAASAILERELTLPGVSQTVILTRLSGRTRVPAKEDLGKLSKHRATLGIFLSVHLIEEVAKKLLQGYPAEIPIAVVERATWPEQRIFRGSLGELVKIVQENNITRTALIIVGEVLQSSYEKTYLYSRKKS